MLAFKFHCYPSIHLTSALHPSYLPHPSILHEVWPWVICKTSSINHRRQYANTIGKATQAYICIRVYIFRLTCKVAIEGEIAKADSIDCATATKIIEGLKGDAIPASMRRDLGQVINKKVNPSLSEGKKGRQKNQVAGHLENYIPQRLWDIAANRKAPWSMVLQQWARFYERLGLTNATEPTYVAMLAILLSQRYSTCDLDRLSPADAKEMLEGIKGAVHLISKVKLPHHGVIHIYPVWPSDLKTQNPGIYQSAYPNVEHEAVPSPLDPELLCRFKGVLPARGTHSSLRPTRGGRAGRTLGSDPALVHMDANDEWIEKNLPGFKLNVGNGPAPIRQRSRSELSVLDVATPFSGQRFSTSRSQQALPGPLQPDVGHPCQPCSAAPGQQDALVSQHEALPGFAQPNLASPEVGLPSIGDGNVNVAGSTGMVKPCVVPNSLDVGESIVDPYRTVSNRTASNVFAAAQSIIPSQGPAESKNVVEALIEKATTHRRKGQAPKKALKKTLKVVANTVCSLSSIHK